MHVGPDGRALRDPVGQGKGASLVCHDEVVPSALEQPLPLPQGGCCHLRTAEEPRPELQNPCRGLRQGREVVGQPKVLSRPGRRFAVPQCRDHAVGGKNVQLTQHPRIPVYG